MSVLRFCAAALSLFLAATAHPQVSPIAGIHFRELSKPQAVAAPAGQVEVVEFFWYRCPHCYALEPDLEAWLAGLPAGVAFRRVPVIFGDQWAVDARILYALEAIGEFERLHRGLLDAIHQQGGKKLADKAYMSWVAQWLAARGVDARRYDAALNSPAVRKKVRDAEEMTHAYGVEGTPTFAVQGRYVVSPAPGDRRAILAITEHLVRRTLSTGK
jgi:thiol:disulfide interchange protein DsbA